MMLRRISVEIHSWKSLISNPWNGKIQKYITKIGIKKITWRLPIEQQRGILIDYRHICIYK